MVLSYNAEHNVGTVTFTQWELLLQKQKSTPLEE